MPLQYDYKRKASTPVKNRIYLHVTFVASEAWTPQSGGRTNIKTPAEEHIMPRSCAPRKILHPSGHRTFTLESCAGWLVTHKKTCRICAFLFAVVQFWNKTNAVLQELCENCKMYYQTIQLKLRLFASVGRQHLSYHNS